jgi:hypothetical protein
MQDAERNFREVKRQQRHINERYFSECVLTEVSDRKFSRACAVSDSIHFELLPFSSCFTNWFLVFITTKYQVEKVHLCLYLMTFFSFHPDLNKVGLYRKMVKTHQVYLLLCVQEVGPAMT